MQCLYSSCASDSVRTDLGQTDSGVCVFLMMSWSTAAPLPLNSPSTSCGPWCSLCVTPAQRSDKQLRMVSVSWLSLVEKTTGLLLQVRCTARCFNCCDSSHKVLEVFMVKFLNTVALSEAVPLLVGVIQAADSRAKENVNATENCISAVGKVMKYRPECVNVSEVLPHWLSWLPLNEDKEEAVHTFNYLCDLIERWESSAGINRETLNLWRI